MIAGLIVIIEAPPSICIKRIGAKSAGSLDGTQLDTMKHTLFVEIF